VPFTSTNCPAIFLLPPLRWLLMASCTFGLPTFLPPGARAPGRRGDMTLNLPCVAITACFRVNCWQKHWA
jgi:hypothetical protein